MSRWAIDTSIPEGEPGHGVVVRIVDVRGAKCSYVTAAGWRVDNVRLKTMQTVHVDSPDDLRQLKYALPYDPVAECPYCHKDYGSVSGFASHLLHRHPGEPVPPREAWQLLVAAN